MLDIREYGTIIFDCDGVILDSNKVKTKAFYNAVIDYGHEHAQQLVEYHVANGGVSRYIKFEYFFTDILRYTSYASELNSVLHLYAQEVQSGLMQCDITPDLMGLKDQTSSSWMIASGGDQAELRELFKSRNLDNLFELGIFGSPDKKEDIVKRELLGGAIKGPVLFVGDSRYDHVVASSNQLDFVFVNAWSEFSSWHDYFSDIDDVLICARVSDLIAHEK